MTEQGKKVWKELEKMGWSNEPEDLYLKFFEDIIEATKQALTIPAVVWQSEQLCGDLHSTDWTGKCFKCGKQVFVREPK